MVIKDQSAKAPSKKKLGRPSSFTQATADAICARLAEGESLRTICSDADMPCVATVLHWLRDFPDFVAQYAHAREAQAERMAEEILAIADEDTATTEKGEAVVFDATAVARNRLRVDARKWLASKLLPKKYGDKVAVGGADDLPAIKHDSTPTNQTARELAYALHLGLKNANDTDSQPRQAAS
jgi:hypothetical protein